MKRFVFAVGVLAIGFAASTPARADFTVVKFESGFCRIWWNTALIRWGPAGPVSRPRRISWALGPRRTPLSKRASANKHPIELAYCGPAAVSHSCTEQTGLSK